MKHVKLLVEKEVNGEMAEPGWVYGLADALADEWVAAGDAVQVPNEVRPLRYAQGAPLLEQCVAPEVPPAGGDILKSAAKFLNPEIQAAPPK